MQVSDYINWWEANKEDSLEGVKSALMNLFPKADFLPSIYYPVLFKYHTNPQLKHWDSDIFYFSKNKIENIESQIGKEEMSSTLLANFHLLVYTYESVLDIEERIMMMNRFKGSEELKAKIFSINIYNDLLNTAFSNTLKLFIQLQSKIEGSNLFQKNLTSQIECLLAPKEATLL